MDGFELFQLGRRLMKLGEQAIPEIGLHQMSAPTRAVIFDVFANPGSSISDITARVRFPQSQVSACVARLREAGAVETITDPADRRRTLVRPTQEALRRAEDRPPAEVDEALAGAIGSTDPVEIQRVQDALETLAGLLNPRDPRGDAEVVPGQAEIPATDTTGQKSRVERRPVGTRRADTPQGTPPGAPSDRRTG
ncbi:MarR family transcriptional regulator [Frankia sp. CNm7]|uniref:MarR family transcriptional regulator n=1 Tax=Frankia nepalensis TaxID=1836974 RepID=A0A937RKH8_9ACTN|nr:MarR family transcriptional regulator [Frankia nepalensis]MBL7497352.1 MarR family transcriptional regulator [Frankia nepalensis]MBL7510926.1 MarR family transcriptional regulator [Frankia nepalensis]MBL7517272.1 MarR family transcriptional regulator [Frankia nepalensis]MBL7631955.1 MarR family transcriptional regulator [Frankia nepalensis]